MGREGWAERERERERERGRRTASDSDGMKLFSDRCRRGYGLRIRMQEEGRAR